MKVIFLCMFLLAATMAALTPEQITKIEPMSKECREKSGVSMDVIKKLREDGIVEDDPKLKAHILCMAKKSGIMNEDGEIQWDKLKKILTSNTNQETIDKIKTTCLEKKDSDLETAYHLEKCIKHEQPDFAPVE